MRYMPEGESRQAGAREWWKGAIWPCDKFITSAIMVVMPKVENKDAAVVKIQEGKRGTIPKLPPKNMLQRDLRSLQLRLAGASYSQIAREQGFKNENPMTAWASVQRAMRFQPNESDEQVFREMSQQLDELYALAKRAIVKSASREDPTWMLNGITVAVGILNRKAKMYGVDAPEKRKIELHTINWDAINQEKRRLGDLLKAQGIDVEAIDAGVVELIGKHGRSRGRRSEHHEASAIELDH